MIQKLNQCAHQKLHYQIAQDSEGLYYYKPKHKTGTIMVQTVEEKMSFIPDHQVSRAKRARELLYALGWPSIADLKQVIKINSIKNSPVTTENINLAKKVYGPDVAFL